ncbi:MAG: hypothetical protein QXK65_01980 [Candidatus Micrarchaeaceae archaeon]
MKPYATKEKDRSYRETRGTTLDDFIRLSEIETVESIAKESANIGDEIKKLIEEKKRINKKLEDYIESNMEVLKKNGLIIRESGDMFLKTPELSISIWKNFYIPEEKLEEVVDMLKNRGLDDEFLRYIIDKTFIEKELKKHSTAINENDGLHKTFEEARESGALDIRTVVVVKKERENQ